MVAALVFAVAAGGGLWWLRHRAVGRQQAFPLPLGRDCHGHSPFLIREIDSLVLYAPGSHTSEPGSVPVPYHRAILEAPAAVDGVLVDDNELVIVLPSGRYGRYRLPGGATALLGRLPLGGWGNLFDDIVNAYEGPDAAALASFAGGYTSPPNGVVAPSSPPSTAAASLPTGAPP